jgi:hypothetical protein
VEALAEDLQRYRRGEPIVIRLSSLRYRAGKFLTRNRGAVASSASLLAALVIALFFLNSQWRATQNAETLAWRAHGQALEVARFFQTMVTASNPTILAQDPGVMAALEDAAASVGEDLAEFPEAEGRVRLSIARLLAHLGRFQDALPHAQRALVLARSTPGFGRDEPIAIERFLTELRNRIGS